MELGKMIGVIIICLVASVVICLANRDAFEGRGVANAIAVWLVIAILFTAMIGLIWFSILLIIQH